MFLATLLIVGIFFVTLTVTDAYAAFDAFLKMEGVDGESTDSKHKGEIEIMSFSFGATQTGTSGAGGGGGAGKVSMQDFHFTMKVNKASPKLFLACASGEHIKSATLIMRPAGKSQQEYLTYKFSDLLISSYQIHGSPDSAVPMEEVSLNFAKIEIEYKPLQKDGTLGSPVKTGWDVKANKKV